MKYIFFILVIFYTTFFFAEQDLAGEYDLAFNIIEEQETKKDTSLSDEITLDSKDDIEELSNEFIESNKNIKHNFNPLVIDKNHNISMVIAVNIFHKISADTMISTTLNINFNYMRSSSSSVLSNYYRNFSYMKSHNVM